MSAIPIELLDAFGVGVYLLFGIIHLDLWMRRRERRSHLWLACASAGALAVDITGIVIRSTYPTVPLAMLNLLGVAVATVSIVELVTSMGRRETGGGVRMLQFAAIAMAPAAAPFPQLAPVLFATCFGLLTTAMVRAIKAGMEGDRESRTTALGVLVLVATLLTDLAMELKLIPQVSGLPIFGFTFLFISTARALNGRYEREYRELVMLRAELEARVRDRTEELEEANRRLVEVSRTDALTELRNRRGFIEACEREIVRARRSESLWSIAMADLDHFKEVNDLHGHAAGDAALRDAADRIRGALRAQDLVGRWGGEEFVLFLPDTDLAGATRAAESVRRAFAGHPYSITISLGVAQPRGEESLESTIDAADRALYRAKEDGRDRVVADPRA